MIKIFKDPYKFNLFLAGVFFLSIAVTAYMLIRLPAALLIPEGFAPFAATYAVIAWTLFMGIVVSMRAMRYRSELIVYRDRQDNLTQAERDAAEENRNAISLDTVKAAIQQARSSADVVQAALNAVGKQLEAGQGAYYEVKQTDARKIIEMSASYALSMGESQKIQYEAGEGLIGQVAATGQMIYLDEIPEGYIKIISGLGSASPRFLLMVPVKTSTQVMGVIELASFRAYQQEDRKFVEQAAQLIAERIESK
jgi:hypothetical protein